jgi:hypothetical protein
MEVNGRPFLGEDPDADVPTAERIAAGETTQEAIISWLERRTAPAG